MLLFFYLFDFLHKLGGQKKGASSSEGDIHDIERTLYDSAAEKKEEN
jgi:hypothetical protein